jgi:hypothetical protein
LCSETAMVSPSVGDGTGTLQRRHVRRPAGPTARRGTNSSGRKRCSRRERSQMWNLRRGMTGAGAGHRMTEVHPGPAAVVADEHERDEPLDDHDSVTRAVAHRMESANGRDPNLKTDRVGFGPERHFDGAIGGHRCVGVLDAVARRLAHRQSQIAFGVPGQDERSTSDAPQRAAAPAGRDAQASCDARIQTIHPAPARRSARLAHVASSHVLTIRIRARTAPPRSDRRFPPVIPTVSRRASHQSMPAGPVGRGCSQPAVAVQRTRSGAPALRGIDGDSALDHAEAGSTRCVAVGLSRMAQQPTKRAPDLGQHRNQDVPSITGHWSSVDECRISLGGGSLAPLHDTTGVGGSQKEVRSSTTPTT